MRSAFFTRRSASTCTLEYLPEPGGVLELTRLTNGWVATEIDAAGRGELTSQTLAAIQRKLAEHGIPTFASALPSRSVRLVARLVNTWELTAQEMLCDPPAEEEEVQELAA